MKVIRTEKDLRNLMSSSRNAICSNLLIDRVTFQKTLIIPSLYNCIFSNCVIGSIQGRCRGNIIFKNCDLRQINIQNSTFGGKQKSAISIYNSTIGRIIPEATEFNIYNSEISIISSGSSPIRLYDSKIDEYMVSPYHIDENIFLNNSPVGILYVKDGTLTNRRLLKIIKFSEQVKDTVVLRNTSIEKFDLVDIDFSKFAFGDVIFGTGEITNCDFSKSKYIGSSDYSIVFDIDCKFTNINLGDAIKKEKGYTDEEYYTFSDKFIRENQQK